MDTKDNFLNKVCQEIKYKPARRGIAEELELHIEDIKEDFEGKVKLIVDGGKCNIGIESTVVKVIDGVPVILRPGFITEDDIKNVVRKCET